MTFLVPLVLLGLVSPRAVRVETGEAQVLEGRLTHGAANDLGRALGVDATFAHVA